MNWVVPSKSLPDLAPDVVHLWLIDLDLPAQPMTDLQMLLTQDERLRAFHTSQLQSRFAVRRATLRILLSRYVHIAPTELVIKFDQHGKPYLSYPSTNLCFNLSHSGRFVLLALSTAESIGIDIERMEPIADMDLVARHHFSPTEQSDLFNLPAHQRMQAFYNCWTRKEAVIKADGRGLGIPLDSFDVTLAPDDPPQVRRLDLSVHTGPHWHLNDMPLGTKYAGSLAMSLPVSYAHYWLCSSNPSQSLETLFG